MDRRSLDIQLKQGQQWAAKAKWGPAKRLGLRETFGLENGSAAFSRASSERES